MIGGRSATEMFCSNVTCMHATGIDVPIVPATLVQPAELAFDSCPECRSDLLEDPHPEPDEEEEEAE